MLSASHCRSSPAPPSSTVLRTRTRKGSPCSRGCVNAWPRCPQAFTASSCRTSTRIAGHSNARWRRTLQPDLELPGTERDDRAFDLAGGHPLIFATGRGRRACGARLRRRNRRLGDGKPPAAISTPGDVEPGARRAHRGRACAPRQPGRRALARPPARGDRRACGSGAVCDRHRRRHHGTRRAAAACRRNLGRGLRQRACSLGLAGRCVAARQPGIPGRAPPAGTSARVRRHSATSQRTSTPPRPSRNSGVSPRRRSSPRAANPQSTCWMLTTIPASSSTASGSRA